MKPGASALLGIVLALAVSGLSQATSARAFDLVRSDSLRAESIVSLISN